MRVNEEQRSPTNWNIQNDPELGVMFTIMKTGKINEMKMPSAVPTANVKTKELWRLRHKLRIRGDLLYLFEEDTYRLVVPTTERKYLIQQIHCFVGHVGIAKVPSIARADYFWSGMENDVRSKINSCMECQLTKGKISHNKAPFQPTVVSEPFERIAIDISGPFINRVMATNTFSQSSSISPNFLF